MGLMDGETGKIGRQPQKGQDLGQGLCCHGEGLEFLNTVFQAYKDA